MKLGIFLAQYMGTHQACDTLENALCWASGIGWEGVQLPAWDRRCIDLTTAAVSQTYCDDLNALVARHGLKISELSTHLQGQLRAVNPAFDPLFRGFAPADRPTAASRMAWAEEQLTLAIKASKRLGLKAMPTFPGALIWPFFYPWPGRPGGMVKAAFKELGSRWQPILDVADEHDVDVCLELHPGEDAFDGRTFELLLDAVGGHRRLCLNFDPSHYVLQLLNYLGHIRTYGERIRAFHVKDAEFIPDPAGRMGVYGGFADWGERPGKFRTPGLGQVRFPEVFAELKRVGYDGWAVLEWEDPLVDSDQGARIGYQFMKVWAGLPEFKKPEKSFDEFAIGGMTEAQLLALMGVEPPPAEGAAP